MAAVAEPTTNDVVALLEDQTMLVAEALQHVTPLVLGRAWAAGFVEFGHVIYCTTGQIGGEGSVLIIEGGMEWTGSKTAQHKPFKDINSEELPRCERYERADVPMTKRTDPHNSRESHHRPWVSRDEAMALVGLQVRLTDKGLATLAV